MVFDRGRVNRSRIPQTLPKPIESYIALGAQSGLIGSPQGQSPELRNLGQRMRPSDSGSETVDFRAQFERHLGSESAQSPPSDLGQPVGDGNREVPAPIRSTKSRIATLPFTGAPRIANSSTIDSQSDRTRNESIPLPDDSADETSLIATAPPLSLEEPATAPPASFSITQLLILFLMMGMLTGAALLTRRVLESRTTDIRPIQMSIPADDVAPVPTENIGEPIVAKTQLERLIKNELPITFEAVEFPGELTLQGRIAERPIPRVDGAQSILKQNGPHFGSKDRSTGDHSLQQAITQLDSAETVSVRRPHFIDAEKQKVASRASVSIERTEIHVSESEDHSNAPLAKALFQLEQGGRL